MVEPKNNTWINELLESIGFFYNNVYWSILEVTNKLNKHNCLLSYELGIGSDISRSWHRS